MSGELKFSKGEYVVYPAHGVGRIMDIETQSIAGHELKVFVITFDNDRMTLRLPVMKASGSGLRSLSDGDIMQKALETLKGKAKTSKAMWSRRAQEYELKINSGNPVSLAEVIRDLHRTGTQPEQSYSERQLYQAALDRLIHEVAAIESIEKDLASQKVVTILKAA